MIINWQKEIWNKTTLKMQKLFVEILKKKKMILSM